MSGQSVALSVCIPVYNCCDYLPAALESILPQIGTNVEVVVYDGGSTDDTPEVMARYPGPPVRYVRAPARGGIDADMAACVLEARGEYCWLFSGDDVMRPGALERVLETIRDGDDVLVGRHTICDILMRNGYEYDVLRPPDEPLRVQFSDAAQRQDWFARAVTTEAFFSFISGIVVRKAAWDRGRLNPEFSRSCWAHAERLLALSRDGLRVRYVPEIWLDQRSGNDSFARNGVVNRYRIAIEGYHAIADSIFGHDSVEAFHIRRVLRYEFTLPMFLVAKVLCSVDPQTESRTLLDRLYSALHSDRAPGSILQLAVYRLMPVWLAAAIRHGVRWYRARRLAA